MQDFRNLAVWQCAHGLTLDTYRVTRAFPKEEVFGLIAQMRRAAVSAAANVAEGSGRGGDREFGRFLQIARGSATELEYYAVLAYDLKLISRPDSERLAGEASRLKRMLTGLIRKVSA